MLKGKQGRFRQNLLGKRVDYSGRSVIVVGPELKLHECGLPKKMALELFKPFIYARLDAKGLSGTVKQSKRMVEREQPPVWDVLEEVIREHPVLLNRAPTLHRLGIQAFEPKLIEGKAIQLHPLVCAAFNADFDGDQMAVHVPLSLEAQLEARVLMMSTNNILSPANGRPIIVPSQDIVLGLYYLSLSREGESRARASCSPTWARSTPRSTPSVVTLHTKIKARFTEMDADGELMRQGDRHHAGPDEDRGAAAAAPRIGHRLVAKPLTKKEIGNLIDAVYRHCGQKATVIFADQIMGLGFKRSGQGRHLLRQGRHRHPGSARSRLVAETRKLVEEYEQQYADGLITKGEKYNKVVDAWAKATDRVADEMMAEISTEQEGPEDGRELEINSIFMMAHSGARGSQAQMKQLGGMRGLMAKPSGEIIETPIISNFKEGLTVLEYFNSTHGARKGLADTALKTANSGYLTRRLVDVAQDCIITEEDCGTTRGITLRGRGRGRRRAGLAGPAHPGPLRGRGHQGPGHRARSSFRPTPIWTRTWSSSSRSAGVQSVKVRSVLTCEADVGVCGACYGRDLARGTRVNIGEAVGVIAAQSIGEPGTQLTMRTFHIGGTAQVAEQSLLRGDQRRRREVRLGGNASRRRDGDLRGHEPQPAGHRPGRGQGSARSYKPPYGARLQVKDGDDGQARPASGRVGPLHHPDHHRSGRQGALRGPGRGRLGPRREPTKPPASPTAWSSTGAPSAEASDLRPAMAVLGRRRRLHAPGQRRRGPLPAAGWAPFSRSATATRSSPATCWPASRPKAPRPATSPAVCRASPNCSKPAVRRTARSSPRWTAGSSSARTTRTSAASRSPRKTVAKPVEFLIPKGKHIAVHDGDIIRKGEYLIDGNPDPHDILRILGIEALAEFLVNEIQEVYRLQGVPINDKHIETIVRQMLQKVEILEPGDTGLIKGDHLDKPEARRGERARPKPAAGVRRHHPAGPAGHHQGVACRPAASSRRPRSRRPPACSPTPRCTARPTPWKG